MFVQAIEIALYPHAGQFYAEAKFGIAGRQLAQAPFAGIPEVIWVSWENKGLQIGAVCSLLFWHDTSGCRFSVDGIEILRRGMGG